MSSNLIEDFKEFDIAKANYNYKIIGFGNIFMGDDGIGVQVINELKKSDILKNYKNVELIDGATSAIDLIFILQESSNNKIIIIDAIDAGQNIAEIVKFNLDDIDKSSLQILRKISLHDLNLAEVINLIDLLNLKPNITIIGIKPKIIKLGSKLSKEIKQKIPDIILAIKEELH